MSNLSLQSYCEALKSRRCRLTYLDIGNSPYILDEDFIAFCGQLEHSNVLTNLETLVLRGNTALKLGTGLAILKLVATQGIKRVLLENTSVPLNIVEKINFECESAAG